MSMTLVALAGAFLVVLGLASLVAPARTGKFLLGFAATPARHYIELLVRIVVGLALIATSSQLLWSQYFFVAGVILVGTTVVMAALPYRIHRAFAGNAVPKALVYLPFIGIVALLAGSTTVWAVYAASAA